jgi:hypothetical protein
MACLNAGPIAIQHAKKKSLKNNGRVQVSQEISIPVRKGGLVGAPSVAESQEIAAATERQVKRTPRLALIVTQSKTETTLSPTHSDVAGWQTRLA